MCGCCILSEMTWTLNHQTCIVFTACTAKCVLDKLVGELRPGSRNAIAMSVYQLEKSSVTEHSFDLIHQLVLNKLMSINSCTWTIS